MTKATQTHQIDVVITIEAKVKSSTTLSFDSTPYRRPDGSLDKDALTKRIRELFDAGALENELDVDDATLETFDVQVEEDPDQNRR